MRVFVVVPLRGETVIVSPKPHIRAQRDGRLLELNSRHPRSVRAGDNCVAADDADAAMHRGKRLCVMVSRARRVMNQNNAPGRGSLVQQRVMASNGSMFEMSIGGRAGAAIVGREGERERGDTARGVIQHKGRDRVMDRVSTQVETSSAAQRVQQKTHRRHNV